MRLKDWDKRLTEAVMLHTEMKSDWGISDCFKFPMACVEAVIGYDPWAGIEYENEFGAARLLLDRGFKNIAEAFAEKFIELDNSNYARRGDIGVIKNGDSFSGVVILGSEIVGKSTSGMTYLPRSKLVKTFQVE